MKRYFKSRSEHPQLGAGTVWIEFDGEFPTRQAERWGHAWFCSLDHDPTAIAGGLVDQPLSALDPEIAEDEITQAEFEAAWDEAVRLRSQGAAGRDDPL